MGVIGPLSRRVGATGRIFGVDRDPLQLAGARQYVGEQSLGNVEIVEDNAYASALPGHSFDFVHARFLLAPVGHDDELLRECGAWQNRAGSSRHRNPTRRLGTSIPPTRIGSV
jgi:ubiquinone/menaquinone biosynthesis C-methylase UbiE